MKINKIKIYIFYQILKNFFLILFIFLSIAWLLQITRLFTITNFIHIEIIDIIILSFYLIPNIVTVITPFILIFSLLLCFIKLNKDNELIAIQTLGVGLKPFKSSLFLFSSLIIFFFIILNFYLAPIIYDKYKIKEYDLRNKLDFNKIAFSNFLSLNNKTILDFNKKNNEYEDIFITFQDDDENIIFAKNGKIFSKNNQYNFQLSDGFKISIKNKEQIEKLEFKNYILKIQNNNIKNSKTIDRNTFTIFDDINTNNYLNLSFKFIDIILILYVIYIFYINNLRSIKFNYNNNIYYVISSIIILISNQVIKNSEVIIFNYFLFIISLVMFSLIITYIKQRYEQN